jgi:outer membrane protein TolC
MAGRSRRWLGARVLGLWFLGAAPLLAQTPAPDGPAPAPTPLTVDEAVARALERNLDIAVERLNPRTFDFSLAGLRASYRPLVSATIGERSQLNPPTSQLNGGQRVANDTLTYNGGVSQALPWGGGSLGLTWNNGRTDTTNLFANYNPSYVSTLAATLVQPLGRGFRIDDTRQQLLVTKLNRDISESQLRSTITNTLADVRNAYWDYVYTVDVVEVARRSLELAQKLVADNRVRVDAGALAPIDIVEAEAEAASRQQELAQAEAAAQTAQLALKRLIVDGPGDPLWRTTITPTDRPVFLPVTVDPDRAVRRALSERQDLQQARTQLQANDVTLRYLKDQTLPGVDLVGGYSLQGLGGTQFIRSGSGIGSSIIGTIPGGFGDALSAIRSADFPTWNIGLSVSYPLFGSRADADYARARVQRDQTQAQIRALELTVATEVTNAALQVQANLRRVEAATAARALAARRLEAEQSKFEVGLSTNFFVVQAQRDLATAQNVELGARLDYQKSQVEFERSQATSLSRAGITVVGGSSR